jgi:hypothetical protein
VAPVLSANSSANSSYRLPTVAYPDGMSVAGGSHHASGCPSLSSDVCPPWRWTEIGTGPRYGPLPSGNSIGRMSRPLTPPDGFAQCSVGSTGSRWGR